MPDEIYFVDKLPYSNIGKIDKKKLSEIFNKDWLDVDKRNDKSWVKEWDKHIFNNQAKIEEDASLIKLGLESLQVMKILSRWMKAGYDISFPIWWAIPLLIVGVRLYLKVKERLKRNR